ncbi:MAG: phosphonate transport system substrate-binding protein [bacterium]|jgi:phosphonate transport system substrate-binding protein
MVAMKKKLNSVILKSVSILGSLLIALVLIGMVPEKVQAAKKLRLGMIASSPSKMIKRFSPLMKYLNSKGVPAGRIVVARTTKKMIKLFKAGKVDFMFESAYSIIQIMDATKAVPILIREKKGVRVYNSVIFVKKNSSIKRLRDLKGKVIAFEDPTSTSSYLLPRGILESAGLKLKKSRRPVAGKVAYYFSKDDVNTLAQVKAGRRAKAGGIKRTALKGKSEFRMLRPQSVYVPRHVVLVRKGVSYKKLKKVLLGMRKDSKAKKVLKKIKTPTGFSKFRGNPTKTMNVTIRKALRL